MNKEARITKAVFSKKLYSFGLNLASLAVSTIILYFLMIYTIFVPFCGYNSNIETVNNFESTYNLQMKYNEHTWDEFEKADKKFYLESFKDDIVKDYNASGKDFTIEHIYNVNVLNLPTYPTASDYSTSYYHYVTNSDGSIDTDQIAIRISGSGENYYNNLKDLFYTSYEELPVIGRMYNATYNVAFKSNSTYRDIARTSSLALSIVIFYIVFPLIFRNGKTLYDKIFKISYVEHKTGYRVKTYKVLLRPILYFIFPVIGLYLYTRYSIILLMILPIFIDFLFMVLRGDNRDAFELIFRCESCDDETSLIFSSDKENEEYSKKHQEITDPDYLNKLKTTEKTKTIK